LQDARKNLVEIRFVMKLSDRRSIEQARLTETGRWEWRAARGRICPTRIGAPGGGICRVPRNVAVSVAGMMH